MVKILGLNCSPRSNSNSYSILEDSLNSLIEKKSNNVSFEIINLKDYNISHCLACDVCGKKKNNNEYIPCVINDDMEIISKKLIEADGFAVATPVYFGMPSDLFSKFIMRTRLLRHQDFLLANKVVGVIAIAGRRSGGAETTILSTWLPFIRNGCLIVGNGDKTCQFGTMAWAGGKGHIMSDEWGLEQARDTVERIYEVANIVKEGSSSLNYENYMKFCYKSGTR